MTPPAIVAAAGRARIGVITNPGSRRNLSGFAAMTELLDGAPNARHAVLEKIADIPGILDRFAADGIDVVAVAGGDGTVQAVLTAIYGRRPFQRVPLLAVLPRGTTNMTAADIGLPRQGDKDLLGSLRRLLAASPTELEATSVETRRILRAENVLDREPQYGMFFGGAGICRAIEACRTRVHPLKLGADLTAAVMLAGVLGGWLLGRRRRAEQGGIFYGDRVSMTFDDGRTETLEVLLILATTLERLVLGSRPFWGGGGGQLRFTAIAYPPKGLLRHARRVLYGGEDRALPAGYLSRAGDRVALAMNCPFTLDGEIFQPTPGRALILTAADEARFVRL